MSYCPTLQQQSLLSGVQIYNRPHLLAAALNQLEILSTQPTPDSEPTLQVCCGCRVDLLDLEDSSRCVFELVMPRAAAPQKGRISVLSPLGSCLLGLRKHDIAQIQVWRRNFRFQILDIVQL